MLLVVCVLMSGVCRLVFVSSVGGRVVCRLRVRVWFCVVACLLFVFAVVVWLFCLLWVVRSVLSVVVWLLLLAVGWFILLSFVVCCLLFVVCLSAIAVVCFLSVLGC